MNLTNKTNEELIKLISDAAAELEKRRQANESQATTLDDTDGGGDHPPVSKFP